MKFLFPVLLLLIIIGVSFIGVYSSPVYNESMKWLPLIIGIPMGGFLSIFLYLISETDRKNLN